MACSVASGETTMKQCAGIDVSLNRFDWIMIPVVKRQAQPTISSREPQ